MSRVLSIPLAMSVDRYDKLTLNLAGFLIIRIIQVTNHGGGVTSRSYEEVTYILGIAVPLTITKIIKKKPQCNHALILKSLRQLLFLPLSTFNEIIKSKDVYFLRK